MSLAERHALASKGHRERGRHHAFDRSRLPHHRGIQGQSANHARSYRDRREDGIERIEDRLLVFLEILLIAHGHAGGQGEKPHHGAGGARGLAPDEFHRIRILLLGHQARPRRERLGQGEETVGQRRVVDQVLGQPGQVTLSLSKSEHELRREVTVGDRVKSVLGDRGEIESPGQGLALQRKRRARERARPEGQHIHSRPCIAEPLEVTNQRPGVGARPVPERDGLGFAGVRVAGHGKRRALKAALHQGRDEIPDTGTKVVDGAADEKAKRRDGLLIATAAEVALAGERTDLLLQPRLHERVNVLDVDVGISRIRLVLRQHAREATIELRRILRGKSAALAQGHRVGP